MSQKAYVRPLVRSEHTVQTNVPEYDSMLEEHIEESLTTPPGQARGHKDDYATPKPSVIKTRIVRKERQHSVLPQHVTRQGGRSSSSGSYTSHLSPRSTGTVTSSAMRRSTSTDYLDLPSDGHRSDCPTEHGMKPWGSCTNMDQYDQQNGPHLNYGHGYHAQHGHPSLVPHSSNYPSGGVHYNSHGMAGPQHMYPRTSSAPNSPSRPEDMKENIAQNLFGTADPRSHGAGGSPPYATKLPEYNPGAYGTVPMHSTHNGPTESAYGTMYSAGGHTLSDNSATISLMTDLAQWQQRQQEQLRRQQQELQKPSRSSSSLSSHPQPSLNSALSSAPDPHKWDSIKRVADSFLKEKDMVIDRQKLHLMQTEQRLKDTESQLKQTLIKVAHCEGDALNLKLQELQYESASLKAQMAEVCSSKDHQIDELQKKLGAAEYELRQLKLSVKEETSTMDQDIRKLRQKMSEKEDDLTEWQQKHKELEQKYAEARKKIKSLERYMDDLPTADEYSAKRKELKSVKDELHVSKGAIMNLEGKVAELQKTIRSKDAMVDAMEKQENLLTAKVANLQVEQQEQQAKMARLMDNSALMRTEQELQDLKRENENLNIDLEKARKLMESKDKRTKQGEARHHGQLRDLEERLAQEENLVTALREEMRVKDEEVKKIRQSMKQLVKQNQELLEDSISMKDKVRDAEQLMSSDTKKLEKCLMKEMDICYSELQSLVQICLQRAEGQDPNMSLLLGVRAPSVAEADDGNSAGVEGAVASLKYKVSTMRNLRQDVDKLRGIISDKYAEDMGANLNCTQQ